MKYVIFKDKNMFLPVIFPDHITHSEVKIGDSEVFSAGFLNIKTAGFVEILPEKSESLNIGPKEIDQSILIRAVNNFGTAYFLDFDDI
ncbi:hypothetical protein V2E39_16985 [Chryseobacterium arthrosphaerae]|uniref:Uncharacterized protein n=1 Tax=Chryseobacterium arthrosphaerae TaxID=651561 RepID=A0ABU7R2U4_9FLAO